MLVKDMEGGLFELEAHEVARHHDEELREGEVGTRSRAGHDRLDHAQPPHAAVDHDVVHEIGERASITPLPLECNSLRPLRVPVLAARAGLDERLLTVITMQDEVEVVPDPVLRGLEQGAADDGEVERGRKVEREGDGSK